ncbi:MAG TPA: sigma-70 family RNA polymerase sigma factor, partial [Planctomycetota bacterium]|nr:sigma-70 family RNA polymerase sigma factor [Planctomycetota bacterium]
MDASADLSSPFDAALADDGFVRALARRLTRASDAEDLAQDAWLAALRRRPDGGIRGWLAKALSHLAANRGRGDRRRRRREEIAARPEATASPERSLLEREEVRRKLIAAVVALGPPASTVLVLRFFEELSPKEIARRLEMPDATVRSHLKRGLSRLRERLADDRDARGRSALA